MRRRKNHLGSAAIPNGLDEDGPRDSHRRSRRAVNIILGNHDEVMEFSRVRPDVAQANSIRFS